MATQTKDQAQAASDAAKAALVAAANAQFIAEADAIILQREAQGEKFVKLALVPNSNLSDIIEYYKGYGYAVAPPKATQWQAGQPANLFGWFWEAYWNQNLALIDVESRTIIISWQ